MFLVLVTAKEMEACPGEDLLALDKHLQTKHHYQTLQSGSVTAYFSMQLQKMRV